MGTVLVRAILMALLVAGPLLSQPMRANAAAPGFAPGRTTRMSVNSAGVPSNPAVILGTIAAGGRYVTFASNATNLVAGTGGFFEVYRHDRLTGVTDIASLGSTGTPVQNAWTSLSAVPSETAASRALSRDLAKRGFRFVGPIICYAFMQSVGMVNDHVVDCFRWAVVRRLARPRTPDTTSRLPRSPRQSLAKRSVKTSVSVGRGQGPRPRGSHRT